MAKAEKVSQPALPATPTQWVAGDPGYEPVEHPPETFFLLVAAPPEYDQKLLLVIYSLFEAGEPLGGLDGRRYLVNAENGNDALNQVKRLEAQIAENDPMHQAVYNTTKWQVKLMGRADLLVHAGRDPEPAKPHEALRGQLDHAAAVRRRDRALAAGIATAEPLPRGRQ